MSTTWWVKQCSHCSGLGAGGPRPWSQGAAGRAEGLPPAYRQGLVLCSHVSLHGGERSAALSRGTGSVRSGPHPVSHLTVTSSLETQLQHGHVGLGLQHVQWGLRPPVAGTESGLSEMPAGESILYCLPPTRTSRLFSVLCPLRLGLQALPPLQATLSREVEGLRGTCDWGLGVAVGTAGAVCWGLRYRLPRAHCLRVSRLVAEAPGAHWL